MYDAIMAVQKYIDEYLFLPRSNWPKEEFIYRSTARWAANEILYRMCLEFDRLPTHITGREEIPPDTIIRDFYNEVHCFSRDAPNEVDRFIFSIASNTAKDILILYLDERNQ